jgi:hypothetical protein
VSAAHLSQPSTILHHGSGRSRRNRHHAYLHRRPACERRASRRPSTPRGIPARRPQDVGGRARPACVSLLTCPRPALDVAQRTSAPRPRPNPVRSAALSTPAPRLAPTRPPRVSASHTSARRTDQSRAWRLDRRRSTQPARRIHRQRERVRDAADEARADRVALCAALPRARSLFTARTERISARARAGRVPRRPMAREALGRCALRLYMRRARFSLCAGSTMVVFHAPAIRVLFSFPLWAVVSQSFLRFLVHARPLTRGTSSGRHLLRRRRDPERVLDPASSASSFTSSPLSIRPRPMQPGPCSAPASRSACSGLTHGTDPYRRVAVIGVGGFVPPLGSPRTPAHALTARRRATPRSSSTTHSAPRSPPSRARKTSSRT